MIFPNRHNLPDIKTYNKDHWIHLSTENKVHTTLFRETKIGILANTVRIGRMSTYSTGLRCHSMDRHCRSMDRVGLHNKGPFEVYGCTAVA